MIVSIGESPLVINFIGGNSGDKVNTETTVIHTGDSEPPSDPANHIKSQSAMRPGHLEKLVVAGKVPVHSSLYLTALFSRSSPSGLALEFVSTEGLRAIVVPTIIYPVERPSLLDPDPTRRLMTIFFGNSLGNFSRIFSRELLKGTLKCCH